MWSTPMPTGSKARRMHTKYKPSGLGQKLQIVTAYKPAGKQTDKPTNVSHTKIGILPCIDQKLQARLKVKDRHADKHTGGHS